MKNYQDAGIFFTCEKFGGLDSFYEDSSDVVLYLNKSTIWPCMEYYCHAWECAFNCYLNMLDELQKRVYGAFGPTLAVSLEPFAKYWTV